MFGTGIALVISGAVFGLVHLANPHATLIAAQALRLGATVVTHNMREFSRVSGLKCEDWQSM